MGRVVVTTWDLQSVLQCAQGRARAVEGLSLALIEAITGGEIASLATAVGGQKAVLGAPRLQRYTESLPTHP